jgi:predicted Zn finger-like uncharacterized protein
MILGCPNCGARFRVQAAALGDAGRPVRCSRCKHQWTATAADLKPEPLLAAPAMAPAPAAKPKPKLKPAAKKPAPKPAAPPPPPPPPPEPEPEAIAPPEPPPPPLPVEEPPPPPSETAEDARAQAALEPVPNFDDILSRAVSPPAPVKRVASPVPGGRIAKLAGWLLFALVVGNVAGAIFARDVVMDDYPQTKAIYAFFGFDVPPPGDGLRLNSVNSSRTTIDGTLALVIEGKVTNTTASRRSVPTMRGSLRDAKDQELQSWTFTAANPKLDAGETTTFRTEIKQPSPQATGLSINFLAQQ